MIQKNGRKGWWKTDIYSGFNFLDFLKKTKENKQQQKNNSHSEIFIRISVGVMGVKTIQGLTSKTLSIRKLELKCHLAVILWVRL